MDLVSIVIPTLNRPAALRRAIASAQAQAGLGGLAVDIVVIDNSSDGNARALVDSLPPRRLRGVRWVGEPHPGVANARNAGVAAAKGDWIAFLDDDEEAEPAWLAHLMAAARASGADAVFGPVEPLAEGQAEIADFARFFGRRIERPDGADITDLVARLGTNNSMFNVARCFAAPAPFDPRLNTSGGEDSLVLMRLARGGRKFAWAAQARVTEWVPPRRLNWDYVCRRKFLSGQIRVFVLHMLQPAPWLRIAFWMLVGLAQTLAGGAAALALLPFGGAAFARARAIYSAGLGKLLWMPRFRPALYGAGLVS